MRNDHRGNLMQPRQRATKRKALSAAILLLTVAAMLCSDRRGTAENSTRGSFRTFPLQLGTPSPHSAALQNIPSDPRTQAIAERFRERLSARQVAQQRAATLAAMSVEQAHSFAALEKQTQTAVE